MSAPRTSWWPGSTRLGTVRSADSVSSGGRAASSVLASRAEALSEATRLSTAPRASPRKSRSWRRMPALRATVTVVVTPLECQSKPSTQPKAWNQYGSESRRSTSSAPYSATTCPMTSRERRTMREKSQAGALPPWRGSCAKPVRMITRPGYPRAAPGRVLLDADGADLLEVRDPPDDLLDAVLEQRRHPVPDR